MPVGLHASHKFCFNFAHKKAENNARAQIHLVPIHTLKCMDCTHLTENDTHDHLNAIQGPIEWFIHHAKCSEKIFVHYRNTLIAIMN